ncbi:phage head spike fiber domain-containing protein [Psychroserpens algicola]|uniref:Uncharacterized protein n=1 Tax=Psychroserpens algicola TaxID=1719034 RepID=A0ABT0HBP0_9FLAO|nr:hypothetical protein [Psychroserpens algicola]MCK8481789.1 hypothetical protein [Psychroserpens algicola]
MRVSSSNKTPILFLTALAILVVALFLLNSNNTSDSKYPSAPEGIVQSSPLDLVQITVTEKVYEKLEKKRYRALDLGTLETSELDYVPATITFNGIEYLAEIRLKGDWTDHLEGDKWSFRVKLKGDETILGMRKFSLHSPVTRRFLNEWMYHKATKKENLIGLRYNFVEGKIHIKTSNNSYINKSVGVYAIEETFDKRTIESNKRKESVILKFSEDYWWNEVKKSNSIALDNGLAFTAFLNSNLISNAKYPITVFSEDKVLADSVMKSYFDIGKNLLEDVRQNRIYLSDAFDAKKLAMDTALMNLFGAYHGSILINARYYYNPITSKLEPITFDGYSGVKLKEFKPFLFEGKKGDSLYLKELAAALHKVSQPEYLRELIKENKKELDYFDKILKNEFKSKLFNDENLVYNQNIIRKELDQMTQELGIENLNSSSQPLTNIKLANLTDLAIWDKRNVALTSSNQQYKGQQYYTISKNTSGAGFINISSIPVNFGTTVSISIKAKKGENSSVFGLRIQDIYPSRVDAIFDLNKGLVKEVFKDGSFEEETATIKALGNGWYECIIMAKVNSNKLNVIFGPTTPNKSAFNWEGKVSTEANVNVIPKSITIEEH